MYLKYGNYTHADNECSVIITKDASKRSYSGAVIEINERWDVMGRIQRANQAAVVSALIALETAYSVNNKDIALYGESGRTHYLSTSQCVDGTRVTRPPSYPQGEGAEFSTFRNYALTVEGDRKMVGDTLLSFRESINWTGTGGKTWDYLVPLTGPPIPQTLTKSSVVTIVQEGNAVGYGAYPLAPYPLWPSYELVTERSIVADLPEANEEERSVSWRYVFQADFKLVGLPNNL